MSTNLIEVRANVRLDLKDPSGDSARWTDAELDRAIAKAVKRYSYAWPREATNTSNCFAETWNYNLFTGFAAMDLFIAPVRVEYPAGNNPRTYIPFRFEGLQLILETDLVPQDGQTFTLVYDALHILADELATFPDWHASIVEMGAAGYAAEMWAANSINRINASADTYAQYRQLAQDRIALFHRELKELSRRRNHVSPSTVAITGYEI